MDADGAGGVGGCGVDCVWVHSVDESGSVVQVKGTRGCDAFGAENGHGEFFAQPTVGAGGEKVCGCVNINHWHSRALETVNGVGYID